MQRTRFSWSRVVIGSIVLRGDSVLLAIGAEDLELAEDRPSRFRTKMVLAGDGLRIIADGSLLENELPALAGQIDAMFSGTRMAASFESADGSLYLSMTREGEYDARIAVRMVQEKERGLYSTVETGAARHDLEDFARKALRFPY
jgi:hypothetical protein